TLMNVLYGLLQPDEGEILLDGQAARFHSPKDAIADTITVLRRGAVVGQRPPSATEDELAALMVGRNVQLRVSREAAAAALCDLGAIRLVRGGR
ncbi:MAG: hypothetical protein WBE41_04900, partial [Terracidiphilus sp.]